jgi:pyruvate/2-oxoglutarate/acetoin dehydrogenase E1 component
MTELAKDPLVRFVGYGLKRNGASGTLSGVPHSQIVETTVAENLMVGIAIGLSLKGYKPVVFFERFDFILNALDAIVNHADKLSQISDGEFNPAIIYRCVVGNTKKPRFTGPTHTQNFSDAMREMVDFPIKELQDPECVAGMYAHAKHRLDMGCSSMLVERKDIY